MFSFDSKLFLPHTWYKKIKKLRILFDTSLFINNFQISFFGNIFNIYKSCPYSNSSATNLIPCPFNIADPHLPWGRGGKVDHHPISTGVQFR